MSTSEKESSPNIETVKELSQKYSNWGRWGDDDQIGTLNLVTPQEIVAAAALVRKGQVFSLGIPFGDSGPQNGGFARFNPIHLMTRDGNDALAGTTPRDFYGGRDGYTRSADDIVIMPLQCATQWDGLSHILYDNKMYNGYSADMVSSKGALKNSITEARDRMIGRGVLLDVARAQGVDWLPPGTVIGADELESCAVSQGVEVRQGDIVLIRTGQMGEVQARGSWADYAGGSAPGLGLSAAGWIYEKQLSAIATDTWGMEALPNETPDVFQPLHIILIVHMGLTVGEIFDFEALGEDCAGDGVYEFLFSSPPLPIEMAVASPINPVAIK